MPAAEQQVADPGEQQIKADSGEGQEHEGREEARDIEAVLALNNAIGEPRAGASRSSGHFGYHGTDEREAASDP